MGLLTDFIIYGGFRPADRYLYSPGALFSVSSKLAEVVNAEAKKRKVSTLLNRWSIDPTLQRDDDDVPVYALEIHAVNDKDYPLNGYSTYIFIPENNLGPGASSIKATYSNPQDVADDEDPLKVLSATYSDENGLSMNPNIAVYELGCTKEEFYPLDVWVRSDEGDPVEELFDVFDQLQPGEFGGIQIVLRSRQLGYDAAARRRIKSIEDPDYMENIGFIEAMRRWINGDDMPDEEAKESYRKARLDKRQIAEADAIRHKVDDCLCFHATIRVYASSYKLADYITAILTQNMSGRYNQLFVVNPHAKLRDAALRLEGTSRFLMDEEEIASIWHVPDANSGGKKLIKPLPAAMTPPDEVKELSFARGTDGDIRYLLARCADQ